MRISSLILSAALFTGLAACTSVPVTSLPRLAKLKPAEMDLMNVRVAIRVQDDVAFSADSVTLTTVLKNESQGVHIEDVVTLDGTSENLSDYLQRQLKPGYQIVQFQLNESQAQKLAALKAQGDELRNNPLTAGGNSLSFSVNAKPCLRPGRNPFQKARISIYLQPSPSETYFPLINEKQFKLTDEQTGTIRTCAS